VLCRHDLNHPNDVVEAVRRVCATLADVNEHAAWIGTSWRTGTKTFAHVVQIDEGWPPAYARAFDTTGPATVITFQAEPDEREALAHNGPPFYLPPWRPGIVGVRITDQTDWIELAELITESHAICHNRKNR
jgi:YjbR